MQKQSLKVKAYFKKMAKRFIKNWIESEEFMAHVEIQRAFELANLILDERKRGDEYSIVHEMVPFDISDFAVYVMDQAEIFTGISRDLFVEAIEYDYSNELERLNRRIKYFAQKQKHI